MRSSEERIASMHHRALELAGEQHRRRVQAATVAGYLVAIAVVVGVVFYLTHFFVQATPEPRHSQLSASVFYGGGALELIVVGVVAFLAGVSATIFGFRLKDWQQYRPRKEIDGKS